MKEEKIRLFDRKRKSPTQEKLSIWSLQIGQSPSGRHGFELSREFLGNGAITAIHKGGEKKKKARPEASALKLKGKKQPGQSAHCEVFAREKNGEGRKRAGKKSVVTVKLHRKFRGCRWLYK